MGNCIGKKSAAYQQQQRRHSSATFGAPPKLYYNDQRPTKQVPSLVLGAPSPASSERRSVVRAHLSDVKRTDLVLHTDDECKRKVIQYSSSSLQPTMTPSTNEPFARGHSSTSTPSPVQLSSECGKHIKASNAMGVLNENHIKQALTQTTTEQDMTMGQLFSKKKDTNKENATGYEHPKMARDVDGEPTTSEDYFARMHDDKRANNETMIDTQESVQESLDTSRSPSLFDSSLSSLSCNTTPFSSQDRLILSSSSSSSSSSAIISPMASTAILPLPPYARPSKSNHFATHNGSRSLTYAEQIYLSNQFSYLFPSKDVFTAVLPLSSSRTNHDSFINEFHQNMISHHCKTLRTVIDDVVQQQFIRIHQCAKVILVEHKDLQCDHAKEVKKFHTPSLIFDEQHKLVYVTKHARSLGLQPVTCTTNSVTRLPKLFSACDHCSSLLSGSKLNKRLRAFFLVNTTHQLVEMCFNDTNNNAVFGYVSHKHPTKVRQTVINNAKFAYSYDLDVAHTSLYFVVRVRSWPQELRQTYEHRHRLWPTNTEKLFDGTCFIRVNVNGDDIPSANKCSACEKALSAGSDSAWSYTFTAIEAALVESMSEEQTRFASIIWNYLNGKTHGELPFVLFKHTLFYFFEQYTADSFVSSDLLVHAHLFADFLFARLQTKSVPHYFNTRHNLYSDELSPTLLSSIAIKMTYQDLKSFAVHLLASSSAYLYHLLYLIQFQTNFFQYLLACTSSKTNSIETILETHELVIKQLSRGIKTYKRQLDTSAAVASQKTLTLDCLYRYQEDNVQTIVDYLPLLRDKEPSLLVHSLWSMFIQYFNCLFDDLFAA